MLKFLSLTFAVLTFSAAAAERSFDLSLYQVNQTPTNFISKVSGEGATGEWKIVEDEVPAIFSPLNPNAPNSSKRNVLAQLSQDETDEHFPLLLWKEETLDDFTFTTKFKCVSGKVEQMAGIAFRVQDEKNYYVVRASAAGNTFKFYKFVDGVRSAPIGGDVPIPAGTWHEMTVQCKGNQIHCLLNGKEVFPTLTDNSFPFGKVGFWTKSDSITYFADAHVTYAPRESLAQKVVRDVLHDNPRLVSLKIYAYKNDQVRLLAASDEKEVGKGGTGIEENVIKKDKIYYGKSSGICAVTMPLRDRNGETVAALYVAMKAFPGQTESLAIARALPINKAISSRIQSAKDFVE